MAKKNWWTRAAGLIGWAIFLGDSVFNFTHPHPSANAKILLAFSAGIAVILIVVGAIGLHLERRG